MLRWLIFFYLVFTLGVGGIKWVLQTASADRVAVLERQQQATRKATYDANALLVLTNEYMLRRTDRAAIQWQIAHRALTQAVVQTLPVGSSDEDIDELQDITANLPAIFESLRRDVPDLASGIVDERRSMLVDQILSETRLVSDLAHRRDGTLFEQLRAETTSLRQRDELLNWLWLASSLFLAWLLVVRVLRPVAQLQAVARSVQAGDLQARCNYESSDELGQAAASFNAMLDTLANAKERIALAVESAAMGVWEYDLKSDFLIWDEQMYALYGRKRSDDTEAIALWRNSLHPDDRAGVEQLAIDAFEGKRAFNAQFRIYRADGSLRYMSGTAHVKRDASGKPLRMIGVNTDVTDQVVTAAALLESQQLLQRVGRLATIGGWRVDIKAGTLYWNEQTRLIHEVPPDYVPSISTAMDFYAPEHRELIRQAVQQAIESGKGWDLELRFITYTGRSIWVRALGEVEYENGQPVRLVGAFQDVTERRETTESLNAAKLAAEAATLAKSNFLSNTSHEIRTPLNAIIGLSHLLSEESLSGQQLSLVKKIQLSGRSLLGIVNDVLDLSKIEANEMTTEELLFQLPDLLEELAGIFKPQAEAKNLQLKLHLSTTLPRWVATDALRLRQILTNLLGNALKFTAMGEISLTAETLPPELGQPPGRALVRFSVKDTGVGISADAQHQLFQPFTQADTSTTRKYGGTGLGLSIVSKLAHLLGGTVGVESMKGVGSTFWVNLPLRLPSEQEVMALDDRQTGLSVMVAEDNPDDAKHLEQLARALGWRVHTEANGAALVRAYMERYQRGLRMPDALLLDWQMPEMNGLQVLSELASRAGSNKLPAVLMVTAFEQADISALDTNGLVDRVLQKPVDSSRLFNAVNDVVASHTGNTSWVLQATQTEAIKARWLPGVRVLVVDDSSINLDVVGEMLRRSGALVSMAHSGEEALAKLAASSDEFDAVLMDVQMPGIDGLEATRRARKIASVGTLPIIALTAGALEEEKRRALDAGMTDFLTKPVNPSQLISRLRIAVEGYRGKSLPIESLAAHVLQVSDTWPDVQGLNLNTARRLMSGDSQLFLTTIDRLLSDHNNLQDAPPTDIDTPAAQTLRLKLAAQVHMLRSASGMIGAERMHNLASRAEVALRTPDEKVEATLKELAETLLELKRNSEQVLGSWRAARTASYLATDETGSGGETTLTPSALKELVRLLTTNDLAAQDWIDEKAVSLRRALGPKEFEHLHECIMNLDYGKALIVAQALSEQMTLE